MYEIRPNLHVTNAGLKGLGVFTLFAIPAGRLIELAPLKELTGGLKSIEAVGLGNRYFERDGQHFVCLGYGSLYNHSETPNVDWEQGELAIRFTSNRLIVPGEELTIRYADRVPFEVMT